MVEAWGYTQLINKGTAFGRDIEVLKAIQKVLNDQDALKAFSHPKIGGFENFIKKYGDLRCAACGGRR
ncbi:MAG: hypothetical protein N4A72_13015 [Bacteroidales bacterium]|nr:hypothetical protein [Bacteroidales bacterium]